MITKERISIIEREVRTFFEKLGTPGEIAVAQMSLVDGEESTVTVSLRVEEPKILIGEGGQTLFEIQHVLKLMLRRKVEEEFYLSLDINEYKKSKEEYLRDLAQTTADEVILFKKPKELPPMAASERRIVHTALSKREDVVSESEGVGPDRYVVIRLKS